MVTVFLCPVYNIPIISLYLLQYLLEILIRLMTMTGNMKLSSKCEHLLIKIDAQYEYILPFHSL